MSRSTIDQGPGDSRPVTTNQNGLHPGLDERVRRHLAAPWRQPLHRASVTAFRRVERLRRSLGKERPVVLDSGCGTGASSRLLAFRHPEALVVGVDRSAVRLAGTGAAEAPCRDGEVVWVRAELAKQLGDLRA